MIQITGGTLGALLMLSPLGANATDLVVWWDEGYYAEEGYAIAEVIAAVEQKTGKQVELATFEQEDLPGAYAVVGVM